MAERGLYPDGEQRRRIMDFIMAAGQTLLENGAEVFRVEQTMEIMAASFHLREFHVYVLTNGIFASAGTAEMSEVRNVPTRTTHLGRVAAVSHLPGQDLLVVEREVPVPPVPQGPAATDELLIPFVSAIVPVVDIAGGYLVVELPPGLDPAS